MLRELLNYYKNLKFPEIKFVYQHVAEEIFTVYMKLKRINLV